MQTFEENYRPFNVLFFIMTGFSFVGVIYMVIKQTSVHIFFVDWEKALPFKNPED